MSLYIGRQFLLAFLTVLAVIMGLILLFDLVELIRRAADRGELGMGVLLLMALLKLPQMVHMVMPFAVMIGTMVAFWRLTRTHELVVARAAGVSAWEFLAPVVVAVLALGVIEVTVFNPLAAAMFARFEKMQDEILLNKGTSLDISEVGLWLREPFGQGEVVVHADDVRQDGFKLLMRKVHIMVFEAPDQFSHRLYADVASLEDGAFDLKQVWSMRQGQASQYAEAMMLPTQLTLDRVHDNFAAPEAMSFWQLPAFISFFEGSGFAASRHVLYFQSLLATPVHLCGMVLVAALFSLNPNIRAGGLLKRVAGGVSVGFVLYFFGKLVYAFGLSSSLPLAMAAWSPALLSLLIGVGGLFHLEDG